MFILTENRHWWYIGGADSESRLRFLKFWPQNPLWANLGPKLESCPFCLKIGTHSISRILIPNPDLDFANFDPKIHFWANLGPKTQNCPYVWKLVHMFSIGLKDADSKSRLRFLKFWPQNSFLGKFGPKDSKLSVFSENWYTWYLRDAHSYSNICFMNFKLLIPF